MDQFGEMASQAAPAIPVVFCHAWVNRLDQIFNDVASG